MKKIALLLTILLTQFTAKAQEIEDILVLGKDAGTMMQSYLQPAFEGTIYNLNSGWYRTAKPHKLFGFDITLNATLSTVPGNRKNFTFNAEEYNNVRLQSNNTQAELPTAYGGDTDEVLIVTKEVTANVPPFGEQTQNAEFDMDALDGIAGELGFNQVPAAMVQAGIGLPFKTDVTVRFLPEVGGDNFKTNLFGVGVKHNILQYFPIAKRIPLVDVSLFGGYTKLSSQYLPGEEGQTIDMEVTSLTGQLLGSVDVKLVNFFVGLGYSTGNSSLVVKGDYEFQYRDPNTGTPFGQPQKIDPEDLPNLKNDVTSFMTTAGMSINLAFFKIYGSYTLQEYNSVNAGVAFSFR